MDLKNVPKKRLGEILIEEGCLSAKDLDKALEIQKKEGGLIGNILVRHQWISEEELIAALSKKLSLPFIRISNYSVNRTVLRHVPRELAEAYLLFPFEEDDDCISVAMSDPLDDEAGEKLSKMISAPVQIFLSTATEIKNNIELYYGNSVNTGPSGAKPK